MIQYMTNKCTNNIYFIMFTELPSLESLCWQFHKKQANQLNKLAVQRSSTFPLEIGHTRTAHNHLILLHPIEEIHKAKIQYDCCLNLLTISSYLDHPLHLLKEMAKKTDLRSVPRDLKYTRACWIINNLWCSHQTQQTDSIQNWLDCTCVTNWQRKELRSKLGSFFFFGCVCVRA